MANYMQREQRMLQLQFTTHNTYTQRLTRQHISFEILNIAQRIAFFTL